MFVPIALGDDGGAALGRKGVDFEVRGGAFDFGNQTEDVADGEIAEPVWQRPPVALRRRERVEQSIERAVLTEEEDFVLAAEVVIEVRRRQIGRDRDVSHSGGREAATAEDLGGGTQDADAARICADRTPVRKVNHGSILH